MIISLNWLKKFTDIDLSIDELIELIGSRLVEIEEVIGLGEKYKDALVVKVVEVNKLEGSDHLNVTKIDDGGATNNIERDEKGLIQVVCGAPNVRQDQLVVWLPAGATVPNTFMTSSPFVLGTRELLGATSNGMIASAKELDLYDEHEGILEITDEIKPGTKFSEAYELDDYLFDIENKSLTHRPDCFSMVGFAREVAAIAGKTFHTPKWLTNLSPDFSDVMNDKVKLDIKIDNSELSSRYMAIVMSGADGNKKSPLLVQTYLSRVGVRPINAVVDVTNYLMMLTGQPLHAFDYDKLVTVGGGSADVHVRSGRENESLELLDGRTITTTPDDIVIAAGDTAIGLAGAMGGQGTAIDKNTKNIIIESATFNLYNLRATQMRHGIFSEAITRFTKGQPASLASPVLFQAIGLMGEWSGASCISNMAETYPVSQQQIKIEFSTDTINNVLGSKHDGEIVSGTLRNAEFNVAQGDSDNITATVPYWRADIHIAEDIAEEIGRLNGYDNIELQFPKRDFTAVSRNKFDEFRNQLRKILVKGGANEVLSYSFTDNKIIEKSGQDVSKSYKVVNSISPELQYYRQSLTPSLLNLVHPNIKNGYDRFAIFEINKSHSKKTGLNDEGVPVEFDLVSLVVTDINMLSSSPYYLAKRILDYLRVSFGLAFKYEPIPADIDNPGFGPFEYQRSARVIDKNTDVPLGVVGEYKRSVTKGFKLPKYTAGFELSLPALFEIVNKLGPRYKPLSRYPSSERDICFRVRGDVQYSQIENAIESALQPVELESNMMPIDIYQSDGSNTKNITVRIKLTSHDHTLTGDEVTAVIKSISSLVVEKTHAVVI